MYGGLCLFDLPPGDQTSVNASNGSASPVAVVDCIDDRHVGAVASPTMTKRPVDLHVAAASPTSAA
jgi:hypothetical protein